MFAQIVSPGAITGAPISWLLGGNPFLDGVCSSPMASSAFTRATSFS